MSVLFALSPLMVSSRISKRINRLSVSHSLRLRECALVSRRHRRSAFSTRCSLVLFVGRASIDVLDGSTFATDRRSRRIDVLDAVLFVGRRAGHLLVRENQLGSGIVRSGAVESRHVSNGSNFLGENENKCNECPGRGRHNHQEVSRDGRTCVETGISVCSGDKGLRLIRSISRQVGGLPERRAVVRTTT